MKVIIITILFFISATIQTLAFQNDNFKKAKQLISEKKFDEAKTLLETIIEKDDKNHEAYFMLGKVYLSLQEPEDATDNFEEAVDLQEDNADYHYWLGQAIAMDVQSSNLISQAMMAGDILDEFEKAVELDSTHIPGRMGVIGFYLNAPGIVGGDLDKAKLNSNELLKFDEAKGRIFLAQIYLKEEKMDSVEFQIKILEDKFGNDKSMSSIYNSLGYFYLGQGNTAKAIRAFERQVELNPNSANVYDSLGDGYKAAKRYDEAITQYKKALEINPNFSASLNNLKELYEKQEANLDN